MITNMDFDQGKQKIVGGVKVVHKKARGKLVGYISAALAFVAGLAWNDAISALIKYLFPLDTNSLLAKFLYATILTIIITIVIVYLERLSEEDEA